MHPAILLPFLLSFEQILPVPWAIQGKEVSLCNAGRTQNLSHVNDLDNGPGRADALAHQLLYMFLICLASPAGSRSMRTIVIPSARLSPELGHDSINMRAQLASEPRTQRSEVSGAGKPTPSLSAYRAACAARQ